jgi:hypothetical protein
LAGKLFVLKALSYDLLQNLSEPLGIRALALVEPKTLFVKIPEQVKRFNAYIRAFDHSLEQAPKVLNPVRVNVSVDVFFRVVNDHVKVIGIQESCSTWARTFGWRDS